MSTRNTIKPFLLLVQILIFQAAFPQSGQQFLNVRYHDGNTLPWYGEFSNPHLNADEFWSWFNTEYADYKHFKFYMVSDQSDELGFRHIRYGQMLDNHPVNHTAIILHLKDGYVESFNTDLFAFTPLEYAKNLTPEVTLNIALKHYHVTDAAVESKTPEIIWAKEQSGYAQGQHFLCHAYRIKVAEGVQHDKIYINNGNGAIVLKENLIVHTDTINKCKTLYRGVRNFTADFVAVDSFRLRETGKRKISTFLNSNGNDFWNKTNNWKDSSLATNDIHWGTEVVMDMLKKRFNVNSFDNKGTLLYNLSRPSSSGNAYWTLGGNFVNYFTGTSGSVTPCAALDVVGHELGHGVLDGIAKLVYSGESGSLHESFGDIQGYIAERTGDSTKYDWIVGDQVWIGGIRNMANPKAFSNPDTYKGQFWGGGFHSNAGVQNHFFYTLVAGDTGTNDNSYTYSIQGLGFEKAVSIKYRAILNYITPNTDFPMVAAFDVKSAKDLYGSCGPEAAVTKEAWKAAGVIDTSTIIDLSHGITSQKLHCGTNNSIIPYSSYGDISRKNTWYFSPTDSVVSKNTSKHYTKSGTYTVYLKTEICKKTFWDTTTTTLSLDPIANLQSVNAKYCQLSDSITIVNTSINPESNQTIYYSWVVGPFNNYRLNGKDINVARDIVGDYYIELKAYYANGCKDTASIRYAVVGNVKPSFTARNACPCQDLKLKNTTDISASTYTFKWQFDDTTTKTGFQPLKNYCSSGKHSITLFSNDLNTGCSDSAIRYVTIYDRPDPKIGVKSFCYGDSVTLFDQSTHNRPLAYNEWTFGFWNPVDMDSVTMAVPDSLEKTFILTVYDDLGCFNSTSMTAKPEVLLVDITAQNLCNNRETKLNATISSQKPVTGYYWMINNVKKYDGILQPSEQFTDSTVNVSFHANTDECNASLAKTFVIHKAPKADFSVQPEVCSGETIIFTNKSISKDPLIHEWNLAGTNILHTADVTKVWEVLSTSTYTICLKEQTDAGCTDSVCKLVTVNENPVCDFNIQNFWINYDGRGYKFIVGQNNHTSYEWDLGDGTKGNANNYIHQYAKDGKYTVKVKVKSNTGCSCEASKTLDVTKSGIDNLLFSQLNIYPNPSDGILNISGSSLQDYNLQICSMDGKILRYGTFNTSTVEDLRDFSKGMYIIKVGNGKDTAVFKLYLR